MNQIYVILYMRQQQFVLVMDICLRRHGANLLMKYTTLDGNWSKRRQTETSTTKTSTNQNVDKPKRRQTETSTDQNVDKPKRRQTKTSTNRNVDKPKRRHSKTSA